jgi:hypothetical protein
MVKLPIPDLHAILGVFSPRALFKYTVKPTPDDFSKFGLFKPAKYFSKSTIKPTPNLRAILLRTFAFVRSLRWLFFSLFLEPPSRHLVLNTLEPSKVGLKL